MRPYDEIWEGDCMREDALRDRNHNNRYPGYNIPRPSTRRFTWMTLLGLLALVGAAALAITFA